MAKSAVRPDGHSPGGWPQHMEVIRRLYLDEDKTLQEVMKIMESEYGLVASVKTYKKQLRDHNYRKNIRSTPSDAQAYQNMFWSRQLPAHVRLSNGQVVARDHLAAHIRRKMNHTRTPVMMRAPDKYYFIESAYTHTRQYLFGLSRHVATPNAAATDSQEMDLPTQKWGSFVRRLGDALDMSAASHLSEAVVVMRQAPQEFTAILEHKTANHLGHLFMLLVVATPRRPGMSDKELQIFLKIVQSLLNFGATVLPSGHPFHGLLRSLARWDSEDMEDFAQNHSPCQRLGQLLPIPRNLTASVPVVCRTYEPCKYPLEPCWACSSFAN